METLERTPPQPQAAGPIRALSLPAPDWGAIATWGLSAALVLYLALENGGYDPIPRGQVGIVVWWIVGLGVAVGALPVPGRTRAALAALGLFFAFAVWTGLAFIWTESDERTATELTRVVTYLGVLVLGICLVTRRRAAARHVLHGVTFALAFVAALGVLSRLHMEWFPANELGKYLPGIEIERRLAYPLNYSSAMGALAGMTVPLLLAATASARTIAVQALAAAAIPITGLAFYLATSGTAVAVAAAAILTFLALSPDRLPKLLTLATGIGGAAVLAAAVHSREALSRGLPTPAAEQQGTEVIWIALAVCAAVVLIQVGISLAVRNWRRPNWLQPSRNQALVATAIVAIVALPIALTADAHREASNIWEAFKSRTGSSDAAPSSAESILDFSGSGRYQFWESTVHANESAPLTGIGPGTFEFWWARNGSYAGFIRDAHSLYMENLAELGIIGLLLIGGFVLTVLGIGATRSLRAPPEQCLMLAAATAGAMGFAVAAIFDWVWELAALSIAFTLLAAVAVSGYSRRGLTHRKRRRSLRRNQLQRTSVAAIAAVGLITIWFPLLGANAFHQSQIEAANGNLDVALREASDAASAQPYAASPHIQTALLLEQQGKLDGAAMAIIQAIRKERLNWRVWLTLARIQAERRLTQQSLRAYNRANSLNPRRIP